MNLLCITSQTDTINSVRPEAELFIGLARAGVKVHVLTETHSSYVDPMRDAGITIEHFEVNRKISRKAITQLGRAIDAHDTDIVYAFNNNSISNATWACRKRSVKLITYRGQTGNIERHDPTAMLTHRNPRVDGIICVAKAVETFLRPRINPDVRIDTIYKGHSLDWYTDLPAKRIDFDLPEDAVVIGCVANNRPRKGVRYLLKAFKQLASNNQAYLVLVGSGMDQSLLKNLAEDDPVRKRIRLLGRRNDVGSLLQLFDINVLPATKREGLPRAVIEAMAYALPCVVTNTGGNAELVNDGETGLVVPTMDSQAITRALTTLIEDAPLRKKMGIAGRLRIDQHFNVATTVEQTLTVFREHLAN